MDGSRLLAFLVLGLAMAGCVDSLPSIREEGFGPDDLPGMDAADLEEAQLLFDLDSCEETHLITEGREDVLQDRIPETYELQRPNGGPQLTLTLIRCQTIEVANVTFEDAAIVEVTTPIDTGQTGPMRDDAVLAAGAPNTTLAAHLGAAGLPVEPIDRVEDEDRNDYGIAERSSTTVDALGFTFTAHATSVSIEAEIPFGAGPAIGRTGWIFAENETLQIRRGLEATEIGGISANLVFPPGNQLAQMAGNKTAHAHGFHTVYDAKMGILAANETPHTLDEI